MSRVPDKNFWQSRNVFLTGHMGFKGAWLTQVLDRLGANTVGYGKDDRTPLLYSDLQIDRHKSITGNVNDTVALEKILEDSPAEILIHLAAQPIVLTSYEDPLGTFADNIMGTASVLQCARKAPNLKAIIVVTSDKVYHNREWQWPYRESDPLGGADPYSASKAAAEIVTNSMISSFYSRPGAPRIATVRAGNVIGGGDWAAYRLLPDAARALSCGEVLKVRNPSATRPWQHVLEPLSGYLILAEEMAKSGTISPAWNFGPVVDDAIPVNSVADIFVDTWGNGARWEATGPVANSPKEANFLAVDASKARIDLGWTPRWRVREAITRTAAWYRDHLAGVQPSLLLNRDINAYFGFPESSGV